MPEELIGNKYQLIEELGRGGFAIVYRAMDISLDREVAIKLLDPLLLERQREDPTFLPRFEREAKTMAGLQNPYIIDIYDYGEHKGQPYIVMPYLPGSSLHHLINEQGALDPTQAFSITEKVGAALDYAHQRNIVHRDVKPANVLFDEHGHAILTDFGIVKLVSEGTAMTKTGFGLGTPFYMAPEQWKGKAIDPRSDLYALGIMVYEMLTGQVPFQGEAATIMFGHLEETPPAPQGLNPSLPAAVEPVLLKALAKDPEQRYQKASQLTKDLKAALAGIMVVPKSSGRLPIGWIVAAAALVAILICGGSIATIIAAGMNGSGPAVALFATETPTVTNTPTSTSTNTPTSTPTNTPTPTSTDTPSPTPTETPVPTGTPTPIPSDTPTLAPPTDTPTPTNTPRPAAPTPTPAPPGEMVGDSSRDFRSGPLAQGEWRYVWAEAYNTGWWLPTVDGPEGCFATDHPNFDFAICQNTIRNNSKGEIAVQWKPLVDGDWLVEWDGDFRFFHRGDLRRSEGPGPTLPNSVKLTELIRDHDDFFWAAPPNAEFPYHIRIHYLGIAE